MHVCITCTVLYWDWQVLRDAQWIYSISEQFGAYRPRDLVMQKFLGSILKYIQYVEISHNTANEILSIRFHVMLAATLFYDLKMQTL